MSLTSLTGCFTDNHNVFAALAYLIEYDIDKTMEENILDYLKWQLPWLKPTKATALANRMLYTAKESRITRYDTGVNVKGKSHIDPSTVEIYNDGTLVLRYTGRDPRTITYANGVITIVSHNVTVAIREDSISWMVRDYALFDADDVITARVTVIDDNFTVERLVSVNGRLVPYIPHTIREPTRHARTC